MLNKKQNREVEGLLNLLEDARERIGELLPAAQERHEAMSERARTGERGERLAGIVSVLEDAHAGADAAVEALAQAQD